jgi:uncharacterized protein (DUF983 family)
MRRALRLLGRGWRLCCPRCGARTLFRTWLSMHRECAVCGLCFEREQGFFLGAMYINYGLTVAVALAGYFTLEAWTNISLAQQLMLWGSVSLLCPLLLFRRARGVWLGFDYIFNPANDERSQDEEWSREPPRF